VTVERIAMSRCAVCGELYAVASAHPCHPDVRDATRFGLGNRRGVAIERVERARYRPGTLEPLAPRVVWQVYQDGAVRFRSDQESEAREVARLMRERAR
jgi:hypothetical protein